MFEITNTKTFKDSVHGYIDVPKCFVEHLMDNEYFQRLRNVEQTGMRVLYPNAKHDRFSHSLGVFHLGLRAVDTLLENFSKDQYWNIASDNQSILYWAKNKVLFLIACLLHDIGHAPFSHSLESQLLTNTKPPATKGRKKPSQNSTGSNYITTELQDHICSCERRYMQLQYNDNSSTELDISNVAPHEQIGALLVFNDFFRKQITNIFDSLHNDNFPRPEGESILYAEYYQDKIILDKINGSNEKSTIIFDDDLCFIARMIMGVKYDDWQPERQIRNCFIELLNGENFDVDKLDYIVRDTHMSGINNISLDVDRLLNSLCIVTKTKYLNKLHLEKKGLHKTTIVSIANIDKNNRLHIAGKFYGTLIIKKGTEVTIAEDSEIKSFRSTSGGEARIHYKSAKMAKFHPDSLVSQDLEVIPKEPSGDNDEKKIVILRGKSGSKQFTTSIENATLLSDFTFIVDEDVKLSIHDDCSITITGPFRSEGSIRVFNLDDLSGNISEVEILADTFKEDFTKTKVPGKYGYNTFTIGFKKQATNVIANVMDARNYLYLWIYAHHKVIYYANFLIPILAKELIPEQATHAFPNWCLDFDNIIFLDDAYIWTAFRHIAATNSLKKSEKGKELSSLLSELFSRNYKKSLYKSLAEYDLFFEKYDQNTKQKIKEYICTHLIDTKENAKPFLTASEKSGKQPLLAGYFKKAHVEAINKKLHDAISNAFADESCVPSEYAQLKLTQLVYVSAEYKRKQLETRKNFLDMKEDIVPIGQVPLLETQTSKTISNAISTYFYLYYQTTPVQNKNSSTSVFIKKAVKGFFDELVETKIKK